MDMNSLREQIDGAQSVRSMTSRSSAETRELMGPEEKIAELEQEMRLLKWHKVANDAALKAALIRTKKLRSTSKEAIRRQRLREKALWMRQVIEEEQMKPLHMNEDFVRNFVVQEKDQKERLEKDVWRNIRTLNKLKSALSQREETQRRMATYRRKRKALQQRSQILSSRFGSSVGPHGSNKSDANGSVISSVVENEVKGVGKKGSEQEAEKELNIVTSLDKLVELEKRISTLEDEATLMVKRRSKFANAGPNGGKGSKVGWRKRTIRPTAESPTKTMYSTSIQQLSKREREIRVNGWLQRRTEQKKSQRKALRQKTERLRRRAEARSKSRGASNEDSERNRSFKDIKREYDKKRERIRRSMRQAPISSRALLGEDEDREFDYTTSDARSNSTSPKSLFPSIRGKHGSRLNKRVGSNRSTGSGRGKRGLVVNQGRRRAW